MEFPWLSRTTTPKPTLPNSRKVVPSKFSLRQFFGRGRHWTLCWEHVAAAWFVRVRWDCWKVARACEACWKICVLGRTLECMRSWFHRCHNVHITIAMRSTSFLFSWVRLINSLILKHQTVSDLQSLECFPKSHPTWGIPIEHRLLFWTPCHSLRICLQLGSSSSTNCA